MPYADVNDIRLYYETSGNGPPIVLVTGFGGDVSFWKRASEILSEKFTVITIDNRGAGKTSYSGNFTLDDIAEDIVCLIGDLGLDKVSVLGWSMGSHIAQKVALKMPEKVTALILVSSYRYRPARSQYILRSMIEAVERGMPIEYLARTVNCMCYTEEFFKKKETSGERIRVSDFKDPTGLRFQIDAVDLSDMTDAAQMIAVPTLLIHGTEDIMVEYEEGLRLAESIPNCEIYSVEGTGHLIHADRYVPRAMRFIEDHLAR